MLALRTVNNRAALRKHTDLAPLRSNASLWSSVFDMLTRYVRIREAIKKVDAVFDLMPKAAMHRRIETLHEDVKILNSVAVKLQAEGLSLADVISGEMRLSSGERTAIKAFEKAVLVTGSKCKERDDDGEKNQLGEDFATAILRAKMTAVASPSAAFYSELLTKLPPTSNRAERLFSQAKLVLTPQRVSLLPINMEMLTFLRTNRRYWDMETVNAVYQQI
ncbi:uncharacterized protein IUM83_05413 [Phytophthora cinnamomi]|uniref:uncharacterized protein n=1 Tax=Phytophthora cinnamomi TaxID=4785 RepID=UPI0035593EB3|nr:hypothetical protein IUM83_05413 [Phytophthora cinnamomi]